MKLHQCLKQLMLLTVLAFSFFSHGASANDLLGEAIDKEFAHYPCSSVILEKSNGEYLNADQLNQLCVLDVTNPGDASRQGITYQNASFSVAFKTRNNQVLVTNVSVLGQCNANRITGDAKALVWLLKAYSCK